MASFVKISSRFIGGIRVECHSLNLLLHKKARIMTKSQMFKYSTSELIEYVERKDALYSKAPAFIRRTSLVRWHSNSAAICAEIQTRLKINKSGEKL